MIDAAHAAYAPEVWHDFFLATAGAAAALAGLLFVAISINLERILAYPWLPGRAGETILLLMCTLLTGAFALVPGQRAEVLGVELLIVAAVALGLITATEVRASPGPGQVPRRSIVVRALTIAAVAPLAIAGISLIAGSGGGLYWLVPAVILQLAVAVMNAWVLLVEIVR
ncbi:MAG TPA: hypothetical protein VLX89_08770 [Actinomycetota bacterium]|nr:hypothetical protein [Actinomycetota bacterium]